jgi:8-oxo-dGTP pyrophosphatase MutT (NUDIX family)
VEGTEPFAGPRGGRQVIPRPPSARPGAPAPWSGLPADRRRGLTTALVVEALARRPTDTTAPTGASVPGGGLPAAVLVPLFDEEGEARVVLTRRAAHLRSHRGEVSFPGGRLDGAEGPEAGALREASEEIGLEPDSVVLVGRLAPVTTFSSASTITPVVGLLRRRPVVVANADEVEHVFDAALADLLSDGVFREEWWSGSGRRGPGTGPGTDGAPFPVWFFELPDDTVWGATARILVDLLRVVLDV